MADGGIATSLKLKNDFTGFVPFDDGEIFKEITPKGYVEGPFMFIRNGKYYFMWSEGGWGGSDYKVAYAIGDSPMGPFTRLNTVLEQDPAIGKGAGHNSVIQIPETDEWYIVYHRRPLDRTGANERATCIDRMYFDENGFIKPVKITFEGVPKGNCPERNIELQKKYPARNLPGRVSFLYCPGLITSFSFFLLLPA